MTSRAHNPQHVSYGFTLIELLVTIAIAAILLSVAAPSFTVMIKASKVKGAASNLHMALLKARSQAVKGNASVTVTQSGGSWQSGWTMTWNDPNDSPDAGTITLLSEAAMDSVSITPTTPASITYLRSGRVQGNLTPTFTVNVDPQFTTTSYKKGRCRTVTLELSGVPSVKKLDCP